VHCTGSLAIAEPPLLTATYSTTPELCANACDGTISIVAAGGTGAYQYSADNGVIYGVNPTIPDLCAGTYSLLVRDQENCQTTSTQTITSPAGVTFTTVVTPSTCSQPNAQITFTAAGGTGTYTYSIDNGATSQASNVFTGLAAGNYALVVEDGNGCPVDSTITITDQPSPQITGVYATEPLCNTDCNGEISVTATGGTGALQFSIGGAAQPDSTFMAICAGNYTVTITDANGCTDTQPIAVTEPAPLTFTSTATNLSCYQNSTGSIQVTAGGGTIPYMYSYDNGSTSIASANMNFIAAGTYDLIVTDGNNCQATGQQVVTEPAELTAVTAVTADATCFGYADGAASVTAGGGTPGPGYDYTWSANVPVSAGNQASSLPAGNYSVEVSDQNGCTVTSNFTITEPALFVVTDVDWTEPSCNTFCDGSITIIAPTAVSFSFDGGATSGASNTLANVCAGTYDIQVTDAAGCIANSSAIVAEPLPLQLFATPDSLMCAGDTITLFALAFGGTEPYDYQWSNGPTQPTQDVFPTVPTTYTVNVTDANNCSVAAPATTNFTMLTTLSFDVSADTSICEGTPVTLSISNVDGYPDYSYLWSTGVYDTLTSITVTPSAPATYTISVTDRCVTVDSTITVGFYAIPQLEIDADAANGCSPLTVNFTPNIDPSLLGDCQWTFSNGETSTDCSTITATFTEPGCYDVTYTGTTAEGCALTASFQDVACVYPDPVANFTYNPFNPSVLNSDLQFTDLSDGAVSWYWTFGAYGSSTAEHPHENFTGVDPNESINVCLEITSIGGCTDTICRSITFADDFVMYVPNTFTPDGDAYNNVFVPVFPAGARIENYSLLIFDRWGEIIFESLDYQVGWDGTYHDKLVKDGTYTWVIELREGFGNRMQKHVGHVNVLN
jgi:large repetitive protein